MVPQGKRVLVKLDSKENVSKGGLVIVSDVAESHLTGEVISLGTDKDYVFSVAVGDKVLFGSYAGTKLNHDGENHLIIKEAEILAIIDN